MSMRIHKGTSDLPAFRNAVLTMGNFDGVHAGHAAIISQVKEIATRLDGETVLITFDPHPAHILAPDRELRLLHTLEEKADQLDRLGLDHLVIIPFDRDFSELSAQDYLANFLVKFFNPEAIVIGFNHRFGCNREGDIKLMQEAGQTNGFEVVEISKQTMDQVSISSTEIREALASSQIDRANHHLGHSYQIAGVVVKGDGRGKELGFPTANIAVSDPHKLIPASGVYAVHIKLDGANWDGMLNIGVRPTFDGATPTVEAHLFEFDADIYGKNIVVEFVNLIRAEQRFDNKEALTAQLEKDEQQARKILAQ
jgi:riboflavin kinase/FMN adenylyltransferase